VNRTANADEADVDPGRSVPEHPLPRTTPPGWQHAVKEAATVYVGAAGVFGALTYLAMAIASYYVYSPLGVTTADVGLGYSTLIAQSAVLVASLVAVMIVLAVPLTVVGIGSNVDRASRRARREGLPSTPARTPPALLVVCGALFLVGYGILIGLYSVWVLGPIGLIMMATGVAVVLFAGVMRVAIDHTVVGRLPRTFLAYAAACGFFIGVAQLFVVAYDTRAALYRGDRPPGRLRVLLVRVPLPWEAHVARVTWIADPVPGETRGTACLLYLGQANDVAVFWQPRSPRLRAHAIFVPRQNVIVDMLPSQDGVVTGAGRDRLQRPIEVLANRDAYRTCPHIGHVGIPRSPDTSATARRSTP
jgi:hypothetical protein